MDALWLLVLIAVVLLAIAAWQYNKLVAMRQLTRNAWSDVDVYLKRRSELIPNLVETVRGYGRYEQSTLERVINARSEALATKGPTQERAAAEGTLTQGIARVFALAEAYPDLKASDSFLNLQRELADTESKIASARQYYNACVRDYNTMTESFPSGLFASLGGFKQMQFFEVDTAAERQAPQVDVGR